MEPFKRLRSRLRFFRWVCKTTGHSPFKQCHFRGRPCERRLPSSPSLRARRKTPECPRFLSLSRCLDVGFAPQLGYPAGVKVGDVLDRLREDGWFIVAMKGSHRQFKHASKPGRVTVAGKPSDDLPPGTLNSIFKQAGWKKGAY
jgi:predicted RNA binding protein YcfA (HicA-like mRNA interferase family)